MPTDGALAIDAAIFGGGAAGLWLLDDLSRAGLHALVLEANDLGCGQTITSQGIIHGGLKYTLSGLFTPSARAIREMPQVWRRCLAGEGEGPHLANTRRRAEFCHLWRTSGIGSRLAMVGARAGLHVAPTVVERNDRPPILAHCPGVVARVDEQVIEPFSFLADLGDQHRTQLLQIDAGSGLEFVPRGPGQVEMIRLLNPETGDPLDLRPRHVIFVAGEGNDPLRTAVGLENGAMQRRPLHMVMVRGDLPALNGHCVDGSRTRLTITTTRDLSDRAVWQVGGQIAEDGAAMEPQELIDHAREELRAALPGLDVNGLEWATYIVNRAEASSGGRRPETASILHQGNTITGWPTKLALVPHLAAMIRKVLCAERRVPSAEWREGAAGNSELGTRNSELLHWPRPPVALPPWETHTTWYTDA